MFAIMSRIAIDDPVVLVEALSASGGGNFADVWKWLSEEWFAHSLTSTSIEQQKLFVLGLTRLLELADIQDAVLARLQEYFTMWNVIIADLQDGVADPQDSLIWGAEPYDAEELEYATPRSLRVDELGRQDPLHRVRALDFVTDRLNGLIARVGQACFENEWAANVDTDVLANFRALSNGTLQKEQY
jgi:hypothetical protein